MADGTRVALPSAYVLGAFGVTGAGLPLPGGQGRSVRVGDYVFKPVDVAEGADGVGDAEEQAAWAAGVAERAVGHDGFRVPPPLRAANGRWVVDGWSAARFLPGEAGPAGRWTDVLAAGRAFHAALRDEPRPGFLGRRTDPWAVGDRVAWGEQTVAVLPELAAAMAALLDLRRPLRPRPAQLVHGDLTGNVLFAAGRPPVVLDFSPYWRPPLFAEAVVVADGLLWFDPPPHPLTDAGDPDWPQMLVRALIFRLVAYSLAVTAGGRPRPGEEHAYVRAAGTVAALGA